MPELAEWTRYWLKFTFWPRNSLTCFVCEETLEIGIVALVKDGKFYCHNCANLLYERIKEDLEILENNIREVSTLLGHSLDCFKPGYLCGRDSGVFVAECRSCSGAVCYEVVDILHNHELAKNNPIIIYKPIGFPIRFQCPVR